MTLQDDAPAGFAALGLRDEVLRAVAETGYTSPTPIQAAAIPLVLARRDLIGVAQTGTGKTASFVLPMLDVLASGRARARMPRSIILSPTRELATQTAANFEIYGKHLSLTMALIIGGVGMGDQEKLLEKGVDVLIATPGRLLDWFERGKVLMSQVQIIVIDEADRMLDMGFIPDVEKIIGLLIKREQTLLFSATMPPEVRRLADRFLRDPAVVEVARPASTSASVEDFLLRVGGDDKRGALERLIGREGIGKAIVFCNRKREVSSLARWLQRQGHNARDIHGDLDQSQRQATLDAFKADTVDFLVATDVAARGLDIDDMPCVINFDVPMHAEDYVHRIGRTGRAGKKGRAFTLVTPDDGRFLSAIERLTARTINVLQVAAVAPAADSDAEERPARGRRRRPTRAEATAAAPEAPRQETRRRAEAQPARSESRQPARGEPKQSTRGESGKPARVARLEPEVEAALRQRGERRPPQRQREPEPDVVFGEHPDLPLFLTRPVPARLLARTARDD
ncbi:MAG TPA: DEAD/DEAH box helicase [Geminicoccaceae bacterium]|nr:DEAD/DEAH box helicase [Geminicoccus sp.]HMU51915.1 DEAD/DEAH box helicase [Geminicoccaceae bacterium]